MVGFPQWQISNFLLCICIYLLQEKKCIWKQYVDGGSVFSSPVVSLKPHLVIAATLAGTLVALEPVCVNSYGVS